MYGRLIQLPCCVGAADGQALLSNFEGLLKKKSEEVVELNEGSTIFLVGMMASGKSTVGRVLADALGYSFFDRYMAL